MLSERERRELANIERELSSDDPRLAASFARGFGRRFRRGFRRHVVRPRSVIAFGALVMLLAIVLGLSETFVQGLLLTVVGVAWWAWTSRESPPAGPGRGTSRRE
jgi:hypothetical protein